MAELFLTNTVLQGNPVQLFHDPSMGSSAQGQVCFTFCLPRLFHVHARLLTGVLPNGITVRSSVFECCVCDSHDNPVCLLRFLVLLPAA